MSQSDEFARACQALGVDPDEELRRRANEGLSSAAVSHSRDLDRVLRLPRRDIQVGLGGRFGSAQELRELMTQVYRLPGAPTHERLFIAQAVALAEIHDFGGLLGPIRVGGGKTLISFLAPVVCEAERPLLVVRASLREKTVRDWKHTYAPIWRVPPIRVGLRGSVLGADRPGPVITIESYTKLGRQGGDEILEELAPDHIIADEAHWLANRRAGVTRKIGRYIEERCPRFVALSGTITKRSVSDVAHIGVWALGEGSPYPLQRRIVLEWAGFLDERLEQRSQPGALMRMVPENEVTEALRDPVTTIRRAFGRRVAETPGVVVVDGEGASASIEVRALHVRLEAPAIVKAINGVRHDWELPDGQPMADASQRWRHLRELALGFYYRWREEPPQEWIEARRGWCSFVREVTQRGQKGLDTELQVARAVTAPRVLARAREILRAEGLDPTDSAAVWRRMRAAMTAKGLDPADPRLAAPSMRVFLRDHGAPADEIAAIEISVREILASSLPMEVIADRVRGLDVFRGSSFEVQWPPRVTRMLARKLNDPAIDAILDYRGAIGVKPLADEGQWARWDAVRRSFKPETEPIWLDDSAIEACARWIEGRQALIWVEHAAFGERLARETGLPYYRQGDRAAGDGIESDDRPAILSVAACKEGLNLQRRSECLVASPMSSGRDWEQVLGRLHRPGQRADVVTCEVLVTIPEHLEHFAKARADAEYIQDTTTTRQKLVYGDVYVEPPDDGEPLW